MKPCMVLFPMAGNGMRFGGTFKPFLDATEKKFIELAKEPFSIYHDMFELTYVFIFRKDQEEQHHVSDTLKKLFPQDSILCCILENETVGPLDTIQQAIQRYSLKGSAFICDCDHRIPQDEIKAYLQKENQEKTKQSKEADIIIPTYKYDGSEYASWSKVIRNHRGTPLSFVEKEFVSNSPEYIVEGMIGCHYIKNCESLLPVENKANMSDFFSFSKQTSEIVCVTIPKAEFFGTPDQLKRFRSHRATFQTFFVDIDGTLLHLSNHVSYDSDPSLLLPHTISTLQSWRNQGHTIVLTTGRETARRPLLEKQLQELQIPYDQLITGLPSGPRILINDKKPYCIFHPMAQSIQLRRNEGISGITLQETPSLVKTYHGGSFASVFLINDKGKLRIRKYIEKKKHIMSHVEVLRNQYEDLKRFTFYSPELIPALYNMVENNDEYYFDMEYLDGYQTVSSLQSWSDYKEILKRLFFIMERDIYVYKKPIQGQEWLRLYIQEKIMAKYKTIESYSPSFYHIIHDAFVEINGESYKGLGHYFSTAELSPFYPSHVSPVHGDLTLDNILYSTSGFIKLIDITITRNCYKILYMGPIWNSSYNPRKRVYHTRFSI